MLMLVALVSGVITHKKFFTDFLTFRPGQGQRSWLDIHNVLSVTALPFHLVLTYRCRSTTRATATRGSY